MTNALFHLIIILIIAGIISYTGSLFLPDPFKKIANFTGMLVALFGVVGFIAFLLGVSTNLAL